MFSVFRRGGWFLILICVVVAAYLVERHNNSESSATSQAAEGTVLDGGSRFTMAPDAAGSSCAITVSGHDVIAFFRSQTLNVSTACQATEQEQAKGGTLWSNGDRDIGHSASGVPYPLINGDGVVCSLQGSQGRVSLVVWDTGDAMYGQQLCTGFVAAGWHEIS